MFRATQARRQNQQNGVAQKHTSPTSSQAYVRPIPAYPKAEFSERGQPYWTGSPACLP